MLKWLLAPTVIALGAAQNLPLPPLPYDYNALEPHIDEATMRLHHLSHHQAYTDKLNGALAKLRADPAQKYLAKMGIDTLLQHLAEVPEGKLRSTVQNAGGGYVNHDLFFKSMSPDGGGQPSEGLQRVLSKAFGSFAAFKQQFTLTALEVFGSGWAWLVWDSAARNLLVTGTPNQDTPAMTAGLTPLLGLDVWEHAYYLKHQSKRARYIDDFWQVVDWPAVEKRFETVVKASAPEAKPEL